MLERSGWLAVRRKALANSLAIELGYSVDADSGVRREGRLYCICLEELPMFDPRWRWMICQLKRSLGILRGGRFLIVPLTSSRGNLEDLVGATLLSFR